MGKKAVAIVSIHHSKDDVLSFDLKDVLSVLKDSLSRWIWCVTGLDAFGHGDPAETVVEEMCARVQESGSQGVWLTQEQITTLASHVTQTIEGAFVAFPRRTDKASVGPAEVALSAFPNNSAELALHFVDGSFVDVYASDQEIVDRLHRHFHDVRDEDPRLYFGKQEVINAPRTRHAR